MQHSRHTEWSPVKVKSHHGHLSFSKKKASLSWALGTVRTTYMRKTEQNVKQPEEDRYLRQSFTKVLNAGNFEEMLQMVGLYNICDEIGARN